MHHDLIYETDRNKFKIEHLYSNCYDRGPSARQAYHYIELYLYYKFRESFKESGLYDFYKNNTRTMPYIYDSDFEITSNDKELICASFIAAAVGSMYYYDAFNSGWILHPDGGANSNARRTMDIHLSYLECDLFESYDEIDNCMYIQILLAILEDQYNYMYEQFFKKVEILGKCKAYYIYQGLRLPEYYITHKKNDKYYKVYRYDKEQPFGTKFN